MSRLPRSFAGAVAISCLLIGSTTSAVTAHAAGTDTDDEIHVEYGNNAATTMWVHWHGPDDSIAYGLTDSYGSTATAEQPTVTPVDIAGPFWQVELTGLQPGTIYHYAVGPTGEDHTFETAPIGNFRWDDIGDTGSTYSASAGTECDKSWMTDVWQQIADDQPDVVTHGGDIDYANECGQPSVHQLFNDIEPISEQRPIEFAWGNHEYGPPAGTAPAGTPRDDMANYKGRITIPNPQTVPNDTPFQTANPGCPPSTGTANACQGDDWGWFQVGHVLFISYPEPWPGAIAAWRKAASALMARAQANPDITYVVTFGHRPAYTSLFDYDTGTYAAQIDLQRAIDHLAQAYSPTTRNGGKYVLNVAHHVHGGEAFRPIDGLVNVTDGGGGTTEVTYGRRPAPGSVWRTVHFEHLETDVTAKAMTLHFICGPVFTLDPNRDACTEGTVLHTVTIPAPRKAAKVTEYVGNRSVESSRRGWMGVVTRASGVRAVRPAGGGYRGNRALAVTNLAGHAATVGFTNSQPLWVPRAVFHRTYTARAEINGAPGTKVRLRLRECTRRGACTLLPSVATITLDASGWQQVVTKLQVRRRGDLLRLAIFAPALPSKGQFLADWFSVTST